MDIAYKVGRIARWTPRVGFWGALVFEIKQTLRRPVIRFRHRGLGVDIHLRSNSSDISVFEAIFIEDELNFDTQERPGVILDAGANVGLTVLYFAHHFPDAQIVAVEPSQDNLDILKRNTAPFANVAIEQTALWSEDTWLKIENPDDEGWSFRCVRAAATDAGAFEGKSIDTVLAAQGHAHCDLLKIDIEGAEQELFANPGPWLDATRTIVVEIHSDDIKRTILEKCPEPEWIRDGAGEKLLLRRR